MLKQKNTKMNTRIHWIASLMLVGALLATAPAAATMHADAEAVDAFIWSDAFVRADAFIWSDAFVRTDAFIWSDAFVRTDAFVWSDGLSEPAAIDHRVEQE